MRPWKQLLTKYLKQSDEKVVVTYSRLKSCYLLAPAQQWIKPFLVSLGEVKSGALAAESMTTLRSARASVPSVHRRKPSLRH